MNVNSVKFGTLLKVRKYQEKKAQEELLHIRTQKQREEETLSKLAEKHDEEISSSPQTGRVQAAEVQVSRAFLRKLAKEIQAQKNKVDEIKQQEEIKTYELIERKKAKEMVELLEEKFQLQLAKERERKEQRLIDVLAQRTQVEKKL
ncbi:MAG: flagellar export protein FliJ [Bacteroidetes bacterium]|nr:flagellar export protein FliJ [Bacteroidota bacterium]